jgi:hypothetical protein
VSKKTLGQIAFEASESDFSWECFGDTVKARWENIAKVVIQAAEKQAEKPKRETKSVEAVDTTVVLYPAWTRSVHVYNEDPGRYSYNNGIILSVRDDHQYRLAELTIDTAIRVQRALTQAIRAAKARR